MVAQHSAKIIADSINPTGKRITTMEVRFPRIVLAEFNTHRVFSRNSASSRAIPIRRMIRNVWENPYIPYQWGANQKGMQAGQPVNQKVAAAAEVVWRTGLLGAVAAAKALDYLGIHKQWANRLLEPWSYHTVVVTSTEWSNFFNLRTHPDAHPDIRLAAEYMLEAYKESQPKKLELVDIDTTFGSVKSNFWHLPYVLEEEMDTLELDDLIKLSVARCARVSYLTHDGRRDLEADFKLYNRLLESGHMSPFEHAARSATAEDLIQWLELHGFNPALDSSDVPEPDQVFYGNLQGWVSNRWIIPGESDILGHRETLAAA